MKEVNGRDCVCFVGESSYSGAISDTLLPCVITRIKQWRVLCAVKCAYKNVGAMGTYKFVKAKCGIEGV